MKLEQWLKKVGTAQDASKKQICDGLQAIAEEMMEGVHNLGQAHALLGMRFALMSDAEKTKDLSEAGRSLGSIKTERKAKTSAANGRKGGRPLKKAAGQDDK